MGRPRKNTLPEVETQSQEELPVTTADVPTHSHKPASELVSAYLNLLETIDKHVGSQPFDDEGPYQLMSLPEHLWNVLLGDVTRTVLNARRESLRALLAQMETSSRG